jgi:hypothetical protein
MDACSYSRLPPHTGDRFSLSPFSFALKPCIHGLPTSDLKDAATSLFQKVSFFCRFLSLFSVFLRTRPQGEPRFHAGLREVV